MARRTATTRSIGSVERRVEITHGLRPPQTKRTGCVHIRTRRSRHRRVHRIGACDEGSETPPGLQDSRRLQLAIGTRNSVGRKPEPDGQIANGRQPRARWQPSIANAPDDSGPQLVEQRLWGVRVDAQQVRQVHRTSITHASYFDGVHIAVLSGAGISAESGVPTFRDDRNGLWARFDPYELSSTQGWQRHPERVWAWYLWRHHLVSGVQPNDGHRAVAAWEDHAHVTVITQNVDDLHERSGSSRVHHLHGSLFEFRCDACGVPYSDALPQMAEPALEAIPPRCRCEGLIRPDIVWFGEPLPDAAWDASVAAVRTADLLIVVGTSGIVYPAAGLPDLALSRGIAVVEVNPESTPLSDRATVTLRESASTALPTLLQRLPALLESAR